MPEGWIDIERGQRIALGWDNFLRTNDAPNCKTLATVHHKKIRPFYASLDDPRKHTEAQNHVRYADIVEYIRHRPESIHDLPGCAEALRSLEAARKRDLDSWLDEHGCDAIVFPTNGDVPRADAEEVLSSMQHALRDGVKYSNGTRALKHMGVPAITHVQSAHAQCAPERERAVGRVACDTSNATQRRQPVRNAAPGMSFVMGTASAHHGWMAASSKKRKRNASRQPAAQTRGLEAANERPACDEESTTLQKEAGAITPHLLLPDDPLSKEAGAIAPHFPLLDDPLSVDFPFSDDLATFLGPVPDSEDSTRKHFAPSYEESELLMYYLDRIFPMQYTHYSNRKWGRGWLFWLLNKNGPLYKAALSLAALHKHSLMCAVNEDLRHNDVLLEYHTSALRGLQDFIGQPQGDAISKDDEDFIEVIACGLALISFEVFRGGKGDWQPHLQATTAIMKTMNLSRLVFHASGRIESFISSSARERRGIDAALSFHAPVLLWMDLLACASTGNVPFLPYETWLQMEGFDMTKIMGCQNWVMKAIGDLAVLEERKQNLRADRRRQVPFRGLLTM
ncbi:Trichothecene biosynthesis transcription regulator TRI10 like protein [Verticillium longisporum]|nr:Trichothecene biosynthesis transcription regulator TRI10 like protein [Verticillium longisporum]